MVATLASVNNFYTSGPNRDRKKLAALPPVISGIDIETRLSSTGQSVHKLTNRSCGSLNSSTSIRHKNRGSFSKHRKSYQVPTLRTSVCLLKNLNVLVPSSDIMSGSTCSAPLNRRHSIISSTMGSLSAAWRRKSLLFPISLNLNSRPSALMERYGVCDRRSIGAGATAVVKLCHKQDLVLSSETLFAIKYFRAKLHSETPRNYLKKITGEFCIGSSLVHPNIVSTIDLVQNETGNWCQVMEYCPGGDLFALVQHGKVDSTQATSFLRQIISAVKFLHENGVVHRDIKPENILLTSNGLIKLTDFGSSEVVRQPYKGVVVYPCYGPSGSNPYIAPESFEDNDFDGRKADVWSCAIVYIFMLTGQLPWKIARSPSAPPTKFTSLVSSDSHFDNFLNTKELPFALSLVSDRKPLDFILKLLSIDPEHRPFADEIENHPFLKD